MKKILVTGAAGFIGFHVVKKLLEKKYIVFGIDNLNSYYEIDLKKTRLKILKDNSSFYFNKIDINNNEMLKNLFEINKFDYVIHLAAQAGVRYSIDNPDSYIQSNIIGTYNLLEMCRAFSVKHFLYASSSSVYGNNKEVPFKETDFVDNPVSLYAATKKSNELMAHCYSHLYKIPITGLRFFTVYGPLGRPDMAYFNFTNKYFRDEVLEIYNNGDFDNDLYRDFTYIDDIVEAILKILFIPPTKFVPMHKIYNIGNSNPEKLMDFIYTLEQCLSNSLKKKVTFKKKFMKLKAGDVYKTYASTEELEKLIDFKPQTKISEGLQKFTDWYVQYYNKKGEK